MGYFRILYYISYIFNTISRLFKRHGKFLVWFICIFVFLFFTMYSTRSHAVFEGDYTYADPNIAFQQIYDDICLRFLRRYDSSPDSANKEAIRDLIVDHNVSKIYIYFGGGTGIDGSQMLNRFNYDDSFYYISFIPSDTRTWTRNLTSDTYMSIPNISCSKFTYVNASLGYYYDWHVFRLTNSNIFVDNIPSTLTMPSACFGMINSYIYDYFFNNVSIEELELMHEMNESLNNVENTINQTNEFLNEQPSDQDFSEDDLPSDSGVTDTTEQYTNTIFTDFYNTMTARYISAVHDVDITIPFTNKHIKINGTYTKQYLPTALKDLISMFWYFAISILIYRDLMHKFNKIRSGDIEHVQDNNIKEDLL